MWSNGLLLEYIDGANKTESQFFPITTLHYCAAVRYVNLSGFSIEGGGERFIPLDTPFSQPDSPHPPIFAAICRRSTGVKVSAGSLAELFLRTVHFLSANDLTFLILEDGPRKM